MKLEVAEHQPSSEEAHTESYVGIDLHRRRSVVVALNKNGDRVSWSRIDNTPVDHDAQMSGVLDAGVAIRPATAADRAVIGAIWAANGDEIPEGGVDILTPYLEHLMATGRVLVAADGDRVIAFAAVVERAGVTHLADLFVLPERFGQGIGGQLLAEILGDAAMRTTFASSDPRPCRCTCETA